MNEFEFVVHRAQAQSQFGNQVVTVDEVRHGWILPPILESPQENFHREETKTAKFLNFAELFAFASSR
jgi:hypothetical protein